LAVAALESMRLFRIKAITVVLAVYLQLVAVKVTAGHAIQAEVKVLDTPADQVVQARLTSKQADLETKDHTLLPKVTTLAQVEKLAVVKLLAVVAVQVALVATLATAQLVAQAA
jgi:hypothetical protein